MGLLCSSLICLKFLECIILQDRGSKWQQARHSCQPGLYAVTVL